VTNARALAPAANQQPRLEPHTRGQNGLEPHTRGQNGLEPHTRGQNGLEPHTRGQNRLEPHTRGQNGLEPHTGGQNGLEPHTRGQNGLEPHKHEARRPGADRMPGTWRKLPGTWLALTWAQGESSRCTPSCAGPPPLLFYIHYVSTYKNACIPTYLHAYTNPKKHLGRLHGLAELGAQLLCLGLGLDLRPSG